jgi:hypothetical protein
MCLARCLPLPLQQCVYVHVRSQLRGTVAQAFAWAVGFSVPIPAYLEYYCGDVRAARMRCPFVLYGDHTGWQHLGAMRMSIINGAGCHDAPVPCRLVHCVGLMGAIIDVTLRPSRFRAGWGRQHMNCWALLANATPSHGVNSSSC